MSSIVILMLVLGYYYTYNVFERPGSEPAVLVNAAREGGNSNPIRAISELLSFFVFLLFLYFITNFIVFVFINNLLAL